LLQGIGQAMNGEDISGQREVEGARVTADSIYLGGLRRNMQNIRIVGQTAEDDNDDDGNDDNRKK